MREDHVASPGDETRGWPSVTLAQLGWIYRFYLDIGSPYRFRIRRFIKFYEGRFRTERYLDIGGGTSPYENNLRHAFSIRHCVSADIAASDRTMLIADACCLPVADQSFDLVAATEVVMDVPNYEALFRGAYIVQASVQQPGHAGQRRERHVCRTVIC